MKFTKVVILASALAVPAFSQVAHSQDAATPETSQPATVAEWSKSIGENCTVFTSSAVGSYDGTLENVTSDFVFVKKPERVTLEDNIVRLYYVIRIPMKDVTRIEFEEKSTKIAPPARIVFPASALIRLQSSTADDSQTVVPLTKFQEEKVAKLQQVVGKNCQVRLLGDKAEDFHEGSVKSVTAAWIILENEVEEKENGKTVKVKNRIHLPLKEVREIKAIAALPASTK